MKGFIHSAVLWVLSGSALAGPEAAPEIEGLRPFLALQIALEGEGFSPGLLDGVPGPKTRLALAAFQSSVGLPATGEADGQTWERLRPDPERCLALYSVSAADLAEVDPPPHDWLERSRRRRLLYHSLADLIAERAHTSKRFLSAANPAVDFAALRAGDAVCTPAIPAARRSSGAVERIEIDLERKVILLFREGPNVARPAGLLYCSIAADPARAPVGQTRVMSVAAEPVYTFDPAMWPEVRGIDRKLQIPPGPRSPVGLRWIGLDVKGVGIHGAPEPENIGKTGSHGCFRLTNWDAIWLADMVRAGTPVRIVRTSNESSWRWGGD